MIKHEQRQMQEKLPVAKESGEQNFFGRHPD